MTESFVGAFREAAPYIRLLHGKTVVLAVLSPVLRSPNFAGLAQDIALLNNLGVRVVLMHGIRAFLPQNAQFVRHWRVTGSDTLAEIKRCCGTVRADWEAAWAAVPRPTVQSPRRMAVASGNYILAKPLGVIDGVDMQFTGEVRRIDTEAVNRALDGGQLVLVGPLAASFSGETFNLPLPETAAQMAAALDAEKLVFLTRADGVADAQGKCCLNLSWAQAEEYAGKFAQHEDIARILPAARTALEKGVHRVQILDGTADGSLLAELFTRDGVGTSLAQNAFAHIRAAVSADIPAMLRIIRPLAQNGTLLVRSYGDLERQLGDFYVLEYDNVLCGCAALKKFSGSGAAEISCLAVSDTVRNSGFGEMLLQSAENAARSQGISRLFALSTRTAQWFVERGFTAAALDDLPPERRRQYEDNGRHSKILCKYLC